MALAEESAPAEVLSVSFNQDQGCFSVGTRAGFAIYNCEPFKEMFRREFPPSTGGIGGAEMLFRCNILALLGGGPSPRYPPNRVMIWDDHQGRAIGELSLRSAVRTLRLRRDRIAVALEHKVLLYDFKDLRLVQSLETAPNALGLLALSSAPESCVLACPGLQTGQLRLELHHASCTKFVQAHSGPLAALALSPDAAWVASASARGTVVRVHAVADGRLLRELRRGSDPAAIHCLAFSPQSPSRWLALTSDKGTAHVFSLRGEAPREEVPRGGGEEGEGGGSGTLQAPGASALSSSASSTPRSSDARAVAPPAAQLSLPMSVFSRVANFLPARGLAYFRPERSFAQLKLPDARRCLVGWGQDEGTLLFLSHSGKLLRACFDTLEGGPADLVATHQFWTGEPGADVAR